MASPAAMTSLLVIIFFFLHATQLAVFQVQARDIRNFNKITRSETKNDDKAAIAPSPAEDDPVFLPQTGHTGYGLWGHQPTTTSSTPTFPNNYKASLSSYNYNAQNTYGNTDQRYEIDQATKQHDDDNIPTTNNYYYKNYAPQLAGLDGRRISSTVVVGGSTNGAYGNNIINGERQGMSNTRFVDNANYVYNTNTDTAADIRSLDYNNNMRSSYQYYNNNNNNINDIYGQSFNNGFQAAAAKHQMDDDVLDDFDP